MIHRDRKPQSTGPLRVLLHLSITLGFAGSLAVAHASESVPVTTSPSEIAAALKRPMGLPTRHVKPADEGAPSYMCDAKQEAAARNKFSGRGELLTRNLYVESAPTVDLDVRFDFGQARLSRAGQRQLDDLAKALADPVLREAKFAIAGHTDAKGRATDNLRLSCERALAVRRYLVEQHKLDAERFTTFGFGAVRLRDGDDPHADQNRRVEIRLVDAR